MKKERIAFCNTPEYQEMKKARAKMRGAVKKRKAHHKSAEVRLISNIKRRIDDGLGGIPKAAPVIVLLGIADKSDPIRFLWTYLEKKYKKGMTRKNYGEWHVDHIKPCASFDLTDTKQQMLCFHYTNLQPLWAKENLQKGKKYEDLD